MKYYASLVNIMEYRDFESNEHVDKAHRLERLLMDYCDVTLMNVG